MSENGIFWRRPLEIRSALPVDEAARRLRALLSASVRFSTTERLSGRVNGMRLVVAKHALLAGASDVVEYTARIEADGNGCVLRGTVAWKLATRIQFLGFPLMGLFIAGTGFMQWLHGNATANDVALFGGGLFVVSVLWMLAAHSMRHKQIEFIEAKLRELMA